MIVRIERLIVSEGAILFSASQYCGAQIRPNSPYRAIACLLTRYRAECCPIVPYRMQHCQLTSYRVHGAGGRAWQAL